MYSFQSICEVNNIPYLQFQGTNLISQKKEPQNSEQHQKLYNLIIDSPYLDRMEKTFIGWPIMELEFFPNHLKKRSKYFSFDILAPRFLHLCKTPLLFDIAHISIQPVCLANLAHASINVETTLNLSLLL